MGCTCGSSRIINKWLENNLNAKIGKISDFKAACECLEAKRKSEIKNIIKVDYIEKSTCKFGDAMEWKITLAFVDNKKHRETWCLYITKHGDHEEFEDLDYVVFEEQKNKLH